MGFSFDDNVFKLDRALAKVDSVIKKIEEKEDQLEVVEDKVNRLINESSSILDPIIISKIKQDLFDKYKKFLADKKQILCSEKLSLQELLAEFQSI